MQKATVSYTIRFSVFTVLTRQVRELRIAGSSIVLAEDCDQQIILAQMFRTLYRWRREFDWLNYEGIADDGSTLETLHQISSRQGWRGLSRSAHGEPAYTRTMPPNLDPFMASLGKTTRKRLRRQARRWMDAQENPETALLRCTTRKSIGAFLAGVDHMYKDAWQAKTYGFYARNTQVEYNRLARIAELGW